MTHKHEPHEHFTHRCRYCAALETIWDCIDCGRYPERYELLDEWAQLQREDTRTEAEKIIEFLTEQRDGPTINVQTAPETSGDQA